ncbi:MULTISPECIES: FAD-dependent oxidoreductase [Sphingobium]|uniref:FAD-dependent oxidoreductase n=1 Tax=Sphingobium TaxID=165695 RepID=UPI000C41F3C8|nr:MULTISPECIES: FAD-dependent oxidoreductase [Sphingobium]MBS50655.1 3-ketosteroid dehydrogenase [Sphingobium sp.]MCC4256105.1 FAD-dependent oxidoreductase [Sphingobium lactosutens]HCW61546.1 3-ketosteroid dehydrogenase [Sphingobium sp.]
MPIQQRRADDFDFIIPVLIVGGGGCGLSAALAARDGGAEVLVVERDPKPWGTTSMSTGLIPAAGTPEQAAQGIEDSPALFAADIQAKARGQADPVIVDHLARQSAETVAWLKDGHGLPLTLVDGFTYPGHSVRRMYGMTHRSGAELMAKLEESAVSAGADILTDAVVTTLYTDGEVMTGVGVERPDGSMEAIGCRALILACCGFAGNADMVARYIPELDGAVFNGHPGNKGDAILWGLDLGAAIGDVAAYQGHGGLAVGHAVTINWPAILEGGFQVNVRGERFSDESKGYSEQAVKIIAQPDHVAWTVFDQRCYDVMTQFEDFQQAIAAGAILMGQDITQLASACRLPVGALAGSFDEAEASRATKHADRFGRQFLTDRPTLTAPFYAVKVTGALYHTQGGLEVDQDARVLRADGTPFPNLFAGGGAARGVSGSDAAGYIAGNGLLTATTLGKIAGRVAAAQVTG